MANKKKQAYDNAYQRDHYDRITITRNKGDKDKIKTIAKSKGFRSLDEFINTCIDEKVKRYGIDLADM